MSDLSIEPLIAVRREPRILPPPSATRRLSQAEAYTVQDRLREALIARGERVIGWKAGFTSKAARAQFQVEEPVCGFLLASGMFSSGSEVPLARFSKLVVEAEIAFVMKQDLAGAGITPAQALRAVDGAVPALELVDLRQSGQLPGLDRESPGHPGAGAEGRRPRHDGLGLDPAATAGRRDGTGDVHAPGLGLRAVRLRFITS